MPSLPLPYSGLPPEDEIFRRLVSLGLRPSEVRAARCLLNGWCNKRIANELGLSAGTVRNHLSVVMRLLNVSNRTQASLMIQSLLHGQVRTPSGAAVPAAALHVT